MGLASLPLSLAGRGVKAAGKGLASARANTVAVARDLLGERHDPLEERDPDFIRATLPVNRQLTRVLHRPHVSGLENIPADGPVLLVGNHSGGTMIVDTFVFTYEFYAHFGPERRFHQLAHDLAVIFPGIAGLLRRYGTLPASHEYAERALEQGAAVLVYPGGDYESFRPSWHSEDVEFGGRKGFVELALSQDVPIVPVVAIGGQETGLFVTRGERFARLLMLDRLLRIKVLPIIVGPPFGVSVLDLPPRLPLPAQITIRVLEPIDLRERFGEEPDRDEVYEALTSRMQEALDELAAERDLPLLGSVWSERGGDGGAPSGDGAGRPPSEGASPRPAERVAARDHEASARTAPPSTEREPSEPTPVPSEPRPAPEAPAATTGKADRFVHEAAAAGEPVPATPEAQRVPTEPADPADLPVDQEPSAVVAEAAEPGAEEGAGPELRVQEPWEGYDRMRVRDVAERLRVESTEAVLAARLYEVVNKDRRGVRDAIERELKRRR